MALGFYPPIQREVMVVTDYEMLAIVLMIITRRRVAQIFDLTDAVFASGENSKARRAFDLAFAIHNGSHKK